MRARSVISFGAGLVAWSAVEYAVHRWVMHPGGRRAPDDGVVPANPVVAEHLEHHRVPTSTVALRLDAHNVAYKATAFGVSSALGTVGFGLGFTTGYVAYTGLHHRIHHGRPPGRRTRWLWRNHLRHHHSARQGRGVDYGVTSPLWDIVLGTGGSHRSAGTR